MSYYLGLYAEHYDFIYKDKPYANEASFISERVRPLLKTSNPSKPRLLDLACGTGSHAVEFSKLGFAVTGLDLSADLLEVARGKAQGIEFRHGDMREPVKDSGQYDVVTCLFDSIGYVQTDENIIKTLKSAYQALKPGGALAIEYWHGAAMLKSHDPVRVRRWKKTNGELLRVSESKVNAERRLCSVSYTLLDLGSDGRYRRHEETQTNRFFSKDEMQQFLKAAGFNVEASYADYSATDSVGETTWHILTIACKV